MSGFGVRNIVSGKSPLCLHFAKCRGFIFAIFANKNVGGVNIARICVQRQMVSVQTVMICLAKVSSVCGGQNVKTCRFPVQNMAFRGVKGGILEHETWHFTP